MTAAALLKSLLFGLTIALAIGPIALRIVNYGVTRGFAAAARSATGAGLADFTYAIVAFVAGDLLVARLQAHRTVFEIVAAGILLLVGIYMLVSTLRAHAPVGAAPATGTRNELVNTYGLTLCNPLTLIAFAGFAGQLPLAGSSARALVLAAAVFIGSIVVQLALAAAGAQLGRWLRGATALKLLNVASGLGILAFGLIGLWPQLTRRN
ncbi:MAG: LysE family translocator [Steroidobacteraceae bacterium]